LRGISNLSGDRACSFVAAQVNVEAHVSIVRRSVFMLRVTVVIRGWLCAGAITSKPTHATSVVDMRQKARIRIAYSLIDIVGALEDV
jgi:hypothetical protein